MKERIIPFILLGVAIVVFALGMMLLFYLLLLGAAVGFILFLATWIRDKFFPTKKIVRHEHEKKSGRIIDHDK